MSSPEERRREDDEAFSDGMEGLTARVVCEKGTVVLVNQYAWPDEAATAQLMADLVDALSMAGIPCRVVASDRSYANPERRYPKTEKRGEARYERVSATAFGRTNAWGRVTDYLTFLFGLALKVLRGPHPAVIVGMSTPPILGAVAVAVARVRKTRSAYWAMDVYPDLAFELGALREGSVAGRVFGAISRWTLRNADLVIALGETMGARLTAAGARRVEVVHNWVDGEAIRPKAPESSRFRRANGLEGRFVVLYSGNLGLAHEFETLVEAATLIQDDPGVVFAMVGDGPRRKALEEAVAERKIRNVKFFPAVPREELGDLLSAGCVHLITLRPGMPGLLVPSKVYGTLAAGRPMIYVGPEEGEVFEIVGRFHVGERVANGDASGLVRAVLAYRDDVARRIGEGTRARIAFEQFFSMPSQTAKLADLLTRP